MNYLLRFGLTADGNFRAGHDLQLEVNPTINQFLKVLIQPAGARGMRFRPAVLAVMPNREFRWKGKLFVPGLFDGEHYFQLEPRAEGGIIFRQGERFTGILVPLFKSSLNGATKRGFIAMNEAIKLEAETP